MKGFKISKSYGGMAYLTYAPQTKTLHGSYEYFLDLLRTNPETWEKHNPLRNTIKSLLGEI